MARSFILALDQGTTSSRALVFDREGRRRATAQRELRQIYPRPGWVEHDPLEIWESQLAVARQALAEAGIGAGEVAALGITNQRETMVVWERAGGRPIANAIVWQDRRTAAACERLVRRGLGPLFERTGLVLDPYFSGTKLAWLLDHTPGARQAAAAGDLACGTIDSWLIWNLTGGARHVTDATNASRTLLYSLERGDWDPELLAALEIPPEVLPKVRSSSEVYGETVPGLFGGAIPIAGVAGDQQAALFGQACLHPGMVKCTYGTGAFLLMNTGARPLRSTRRLLTSPAWRLAGRTDYALEGSVFIAGAAVQWLRDGLGLIDSAGAVEALAASVPDSGGVVLVPAFTGLGAPYWDPRARGALLGITRGTTAAHLARATLEGIAMQVADLLSAMAADREAPPGELRVDGGAAANDLLLQLQADLAGLPVARPAERETTALGAAFLAGLAVGVWGNRDEIAALWRLDRVFEPAIDRARHDELRARWARAVDRARAWEESEEEPLPA
ncbi:MAG TPA: glycerol kinase GlpK [Thermoanaerobaculia bacterium]|nr:glycerol kinase GlpK [Thermoanaerobaculia bacterium]